MHKKISSARFTLGAAACCLLLASAAGAQQYEDAQGVGNYETLGSQQAAPSAASGQAIQGMPDVSGIQQQMQQQIMQQMAQRMQQQVASSAGQMQGNAQTAPPAASQPMQGMPDVSGIQQKMQEQMMQQMTQQMQQQVPVAAGQMQGNVQPAPPAGAAGQPMQGMPDVSGIQQKMQEQMMQQMAQQMQQQAPVAAGQMQGNVQPAPPAGAASQPMQGMPDLSGVQENMPAPASAAQMPMVPPVQPQNMPAVNPSAPQPDSFQLDAAMSSVKLDPAVQAAINKNMVNLMNQTLQQNFSQPGIKQQFMNPQPAAGTQP